MKKDITSYAKLPVLEALGATKEVQHFFRDSFVVDYTGALRFDYGAGYEYFNVNGHKVPTTKALWMAGNLEFSQVSRVFIFPSAMEALAFFTLQAQRHPLKDDILILATGNLPCPRQYHWIRDNLENKHFHLVFQHDLTGRAADLKTATGIRKVPVAVRVAQNSRVEVDYKEKTYHFSQDQLTLSSFEKLTGCRTAFRTHKHHRHNTWLDALKAKDF